jgi:hypothetical protein
MIRLNIDPDINDLGWQRVRIAEPFPRKYITLTIPLSARHVASLTIPARMIDAEWQLMVDWLALTRPQITAPFPASPEPEGWET